MAELSVAAEVGQLFRTKRVSEIRAIEASVRADAEERSGNLRSLLGTRYRDLLRATDAIAEARDAGRDHVRDALAGIAVDANSLRAAFLAGGRRGEGGAADAAALDERRGVSAIGGRLLCIVDSPEFLYACLEGGKVFEGAVRFCAAEKAFGQLDEAVVNGFVRGRWERVEVFRGQILAAARAKTAERGVSLDDVAGCFIAEIVLGGEEGGNAREALERLLGDRKEWVRNILRRATGEVASGSNMLSARAVCVEFATVVRDTVVCCERLFFGESPLVSKMHTALGDAKGGGLTALKESGSVVKMVSAWIGEIEDSLRELGARFVGRGESSRELSEALDAIRDVFNQDDWIRGCGSMEVSADRGVRMVESAIADRAKVLAELCVRESAEAAMQDIDIAFGDVTGGHDAGEELWGSVLTKAVHSNIAMSSTKSDIAQSVKAEVEVVQTGATLAIARKLEGKIGVAMKDAGCLVERIPAVGTELRVAVGKHFPSLATCLLEKAVLLAEEANLHAEEAREDGSGGNGSVTADLLRADSDPAKEHAKCIERSLFVARTATAIACSERVGTSFVFCLENADHSHAPSSSSPAMSTTDLAGFHSNLREAASRAYEAWAKRHCIVFEAQLRHDLESIQVLEVRCAWDKPRKQAGGDAVTEEESPPCPTAPSSGTLRFVMSGCEAANRGGGLALPPKAIDALTDSMRSIVTEVFRNCLHTFRNRKKAPKLGLARPENVFLQLLFDLQFLSLVISGGAVEMKSAPQSGSPFGTVIEAVRQEIDPINMSTISKLLDGAVESYFARSSVLLGTLTRSADKASVASRRSMTGTSMFSAANVLAVAPPAPRFSYLPAPMPSTYTARNGLTAGLGAKAAMELLRSETAASESKRDAESTVVDYASQLTKNVGRFGRGFLDSWRSVAQ